MIGLLIAAAISLNGVVGTDLRARAYFDANNVTVGDPMILTLDFDGAVDFHDLHPPKIADAVDERDWKVDMVSAKVKTANREVRTWFRHYKVAIGRSITYRVRPLREGVLRFPALEFNYEGPTGAVKVVRANAIPVHARPGRQIAATEYRDEGSDYPQPDPLSMDPGVKLDDDTTFAWRKACSRPTAEAFAPFDFPAGRMNEARCAILEGNWARAMKIYSRLEWSIGQTPAIERGILAALARRYEQPAVELPIWRRVGRPVLRHAWPGRVGLVLGSLMALTILFWLIGRGIRALACVAVVLLALSSFGDDFDQMFLQMQQQMRQVHQQMNQSFGQLQQVTINGEEQDAVDIRATVKVDKDEIKVGDPFIFVIALDMPTNCVLERVNGIRPSESFGLQFTGNGKLLEDEVGTNPSNVIKRIEIPARYDVPFRGKLAFTIDGQVSSRRSNRRGGSLFSFSFSNSFSCETPELDLHVAPLDAKDQPADFTGIISEGLSFTETCDLTTVETNDVVTIRYRLKARGYVPPEFQPEGVAFEWSRDAKKGLIEYVRYFVADGAARTPKASICYYDPRLKKYKVVSVGDTPICYKPSTAP